MKAKLLALAASILMGSGAAAVDLTDDHPSTYTVKKGDTLWDISAVYLEQPWQWPELWSINSEIDNPHLIYPGDVIRLTYVNGVPQLVLSRTIKMSPKIRPMDERSAITIIPSDTIAPFLLESRIFDSEQGLTNEAYILQGAQRNLIVGRGQQAYVRGATDWDPDQNNYAIYRPQKAWHDPETGDFLGFEAVELGMSKVLNRTEDIAHIEVTQSNMEIRPGDRVVSIEERRVSPEYFPSAPTEDVKGVILNVNGGVSQVGKMNSVLLNKGDNINLQEGNVVAIWKKGEEIVDPVTGEKLTLPSEKAGLAIIYKVYDKLSYALVLEADRPLAIGDEFRTP